MELEIRGLGLQPTPVFKRYVERRLRHALRSFDIDRVTVRLVRGHGRGREARRCQVAVSPYGLEMLRVNETHGSLRVACERAASQARRALVRLGQRARRLSRAGRNAPLPHEVGVARPVSESVGPGGQIKTASREDAAVREGAMQ